MMNKVIDLFAGCGGFSTGFEKANFKILSAVEFDKTIALTYKANHSETKLYVEDIQTVDNENVFSLNEADLIIGGPPCQGFSMAGARNRNSFIDDPRNYLFKHYFNIVKIVRPKMFVIENVKGLLSMNGGDILKEIVASFENPQNFEGQPYNVQYKIFNTANYGIPQKRERVILIGSTIDFDLEEEIINTKKYILENIDSKFFDSVSVWDAISNLPQPSLKNVLVKENTNDYQSFLSSKSMITYNHNLTKHTDKTIKRMQQISINENYLNLNEKINSVHSGSYGRLDPNGKSSTITTRFDTPSGGRFIHPFEHRTITPREAARIQSFPDDFQFFGSKTSIHKQIGNAVPPKMAYFIAILVRRILWQEHM